LAVARHGFAAVWFAVAAALGTHRSGQSIRAAVGRYPYLPRNLFQARKNLGPMYTFRVHVKIMYGGSFHRHIHGLNDDVVPVQCR
jgi:hypothetical protein